MPFPLFDRRRLRFHPLRERVNRVNIEIDQVTAGRPARELSREAEATVLLTVERVRAAREGGHPVVLAFGAHTIKNGLSPLLIALMENGWITHVATNGAGIIHDWEFAFQGKSSEHVEANLRAGCFGLWEETGRYLNLAIDLGAYRGLGYGEAVGAMIEAEGVAIPSADELRAEAAARLETNPEGAAAAADMLALAKQYELPAGWMAIPHRWKTYSAQAAAFRLGIPFTGHPMIGHDIIYNHPLNHGGLLGRAALRDYLSFVDTVSRIAGGVCISMGSAVMAPMIFEKAMAAAQNLARQQGRLIDDHFVLVVDLAPSGWDWSRGEPPESDPAYYMRYNKTFSRLGGTMRYLSLDNRDFLLHLHRGLA